MLRWGWLMADLTSLDIAREAYLKIESDAGVFPLHVFTKAVLEVLKEHGFIDLDEKRMDEK